jgi:hypothetical protein
MDDGGDVECQPSARYDDDPRLIVGGRGVSPDFALIEFTVASARSHNRLSPPFHTGELHWQRKGLGMDWHDSLQDCSTRC